MIDEPRMTINGRKLSTGQAMTVRVAIQSLAACLVDEGLGDDCGGKQMCDAYLARIREINSIIERGSLDGN